MGLYGLLVLALVIYHLGVSFLRRKVNWQTWALGLIILSASRVVDFEWVLLPESIRVSNNFIIHKTAFVWALLLIGWGIFMAAILWRTMKIYHQAEILIARHRITYWSLGLVLILGGDVLLITQNPALGVILKLLGAIVISVMVITPKLPDLKDAIRKLLNTIISILIELMIFALGFWGLQFLLRDLSGYQPIFISLALTVFLMAILNPAVRFIKKWINVQFLGQQSDYGQISREFSKRIK